MIQTNKTEEVAELGYGNSFYLLTSDYLLQMTVFEEMVWNDIFYTDPKKCFIPLRILLIGEKLKQFLLEEHEWNKIDPTG